MPTQVVTDADMLIPSIIAHIIAAVAAVLLFTVKAALIRKDYLRGTDRLVALFLFFAPNIYIGYLFSADLLGVMAWSFMRPEGTAMQYTLSTAYLEPSGVALPSTIGFVIFGAYTLFVVLSLALIALIGFIRKQNTV